MKTKSFKRQLNQLVKKERYVSVHNEDTTKGVFIVRGILRKENKTYVIRENDRYVAFCGCKSIVEYRNVYEIYV